MVRYLLIELLLCLACLCDLHIKSVCILLVLINNHIYGLTLLYVQYKKMLSAKSDLHTLTSILWLSLHIPTCKMAWYKQPNIHSLTI